MKKLLVIIKDFKHFIRKVKLDHTGAYAAQAAFFIVLSMIPCILLLLTLIQFTPVTKANVMTAFVKVIPSSIYPMIISIINQVYNQSQTIIPLTALVAVWSASRGVLSMSSGLNCVYKSTETRNYIILRIRAGLYTLLFLIAVVLSLVLLVFGNSISLFVDNHIPLIKHITDFLIQTRAIFAVVILTFINMTVYRFLPNHKSSFREQFPGALFTAVGWMAASFIFSAYLNIFKGFSDMYGSLTTIVLVMLWLYFCMYVMLLGGQINVVFEKMNEEDIRYCGGAEEPLDKKR